ncbi:MAG: secondary thiamine-phosphate synthase enzyme YjbQ [Desulfurococcales archaeon]|nr:secondary thiamine-phosphate synthase enzyme YjbQ [Desulfurococcales archaeon]
MDGFKVYRREVTLSTSERFQLVNITRHVEEIVADSGVREGFVHVFVPHATAAVIANEDEGGLKQDFIRLFRELFKPGSGWMHDRIDDNAHAHLAAGVIGADRSFPVTGGRIVRGTWQEIFLVELDGPRSRRRVIVTVIGI